MDRTVVAGATTVGIMLMAGAYLWSRQPTPAPEPVEPGVRVVEGTSPHDVGTDHRPDRRSDVPEASSAATPRVEANAVGIPDDAELQASLPDPALEPHALYKRIRVEPRDAEWAARSERSIRAALTPIPYIDLNDLRVRCASTLCEVRGTMPRDLGADNANVAMQAIQGEKLAKPLDGAGLQMVMGSFGGSTDARSFTLYTARR